MGLGQWVDVFPPEEVLAALAGMGAPCFDWGDGHHPPFPIKQNINRRGVCRTKTFVWECAFGFGISYSACLHRGRRHRYRYRHPPSPPSPPIARATMDEERTITLDLGSSPDPLIDPVLSPPMMPPRTSRRSPRPPSACLPSWLPLAAGKQTFELDVGNKRSPQRLRVTVEAGDDDNTVTRQHHEPPSPLPVAHPDPGARVTPRREHPHHGHNNNNNNGAPARSERRRGGLDGQCDTEAPGRPRKSGTPMPTTRKRPGTPAKAPQDWGARASASPEKDILTSDIGVETTPRASASPKKTTKRKATSPAKENGTPGSQPRKRGRPRKQPAAPADDILTPAHSAMPPTPMRRTSQTMPWRTDIWLATMSDQPTPRAPAAERAPEPASQLSQYDEPEDQRHHDWPDMGGGARLVQRGRVRQQASSATTIVTGRTQSWPERSSP